MQVDYSEEGQQQTQAVLLTLPDLRPNLALVTRSLQTVIES